MMKTGRNEPCPCGSGKKSKHCCGSRQRGLRRWGAPALVILFLAAGATVVIGAFRRAESADVTTRALVAPQAALPAPVAQQQTPSAPTPAPPGKVWSEEHGHWHNAAASATGSPVRLETGNPAIKLDMSNPPAGSLAPSATNGQAPRPGMVWSAEHGHWHYEATGTTSPISGVRVFPQGPPPKVPQARSVPQPPGPAPEGQVWSPEHGHWHKAPE